MDLARYKNIILHIGGHDIDAKITQDNFKAKLKSLVQSVSGAKCKIFLSGLLPRGTSNVKPFNNIVKEVCQEFKAEFIDNHDSFIMASGELPYEYFQGDQINLKFPGTRLLVRNMNNKCLVLPSPSNNGNVNRGTRGFYNNNRRILRQPYSTRHNRVATH